MEGNRYLRKKVEIEEVGEVKGQRDLRRSWRLDEG